MIAGSAASHLLGAKWVDADVAVDVVIAHGRPPSGVRCRKDNLSAGEVTTMYGIDVTTAPRTAFDIARCGPVGVAVMRLDALMNATGVKPGDVEGVVAQHPGARGLRQLETVLALADFGAESPKETSLRLLLRRAGLPAPQTQIEVRDDAGALLARLDMGWPEFMVAVEYDGDQHRHDRRQYVRDVRRLELLEQLGWIVIRVVKEDSPTQIVRRVVAALERRGSRLR